MTNEQYLTVSYFVVAAMCLVLGLATFVLLRRSFGVLTTSAPGGQIGRIFKRLFLIGLVVPALTGFFSVTFRSCGVSTYKEIVEHRSYLVAKNQEQLRATLTYLCIALLVWGLLVAIGLLAIRNRAQGSDRKPHNKSLELSP